MLKNKLVLFLAFIVWVFNCVHCDLTCPENLPPFCICNAEEEAVACGYNYDEDLMPSGKEESLPNVLKALLPSASSKEIGTFRYSCYNLSSTEVALEKNLFAGFQFSEVKKLN